MEAVDGLGGKMSSTTKRPFAVVTGATSGIGLELARQFAEHGFDLLITGRKELDEAKAALSSTGVEIRTVAADLRDYQGVEKLYREIQSSGPPARAGFSSPRR
jgi:short-subunit dehydrogenase